MKRASAGSESPGTIEQQRKPFRRQNPVSCHFCRAKKLKCNREQPCSSCNARGVTCVPAGTAKANVVSGPLELRPSLTDEVAVNISDIGSYDHRLWRLEQAVFQSGTAPSQDGLAVPPSPPFYGLTCNQPTGWTITSDGTVSRSRLNKAPPATEKLQIQKRLHSSMPKATDDSTTLDHETKQALVLSANFKALFHDNYAPSLQNRLNSRDIIAILPHRHQAETLLEFYFEQLNWIHHIVHAPTSRAQMRRIYGELTLNVHQPDFHKLALLATLLATAAYFWIQPQDSMLTVADAQISCRKWIDLADSALEEAQHEKSPSIETLQATMIMGLHLSGAKPLSQRANVQKLLSLAHKLGLHQIDSKRNGNARLTEPYDVVDLEIKRRVWWQIVLNDWMLSYISGPQEGTYSIQPNQMNTLHPSNADDEDVTAEGIRAVDFNTLPTEMSFMIGKIWFSEIPRGLVDKATKEGLQVDEIDYDTVLDVDKQFRKMMDEIPFFMKLDEASLRLSKKIDQERPYIPWQRAMSHHGFHNRLLKLHRPFFFKSTKDPKYAYSRMVCLRSARFIIELDKKVRASPFDFHPQTSRIWVITHHVFMATIILEMDYCAHRDDPQAAERKQEILDCYRVLEQSQEASPIAKTGLENLRRAMAEWRSRNDYLNEQPSGGKPASHEPMVPQVYNTLLSANADFQGLEQQTQIRTYPIQLPDVAQSINDVESPGVEVMPFWLDDIDYNATFDPQWDDLFKDLETQPGFMG